MKNWLKNRLNRKQKDLILDLFYWPHIPVDYLFCIWKGLSWYPSWRFWGLPLIQMRKRGSIRIGSHFVACSNPRHNSLGVFQRVILKTLRPGARIIVGDYVGISGATVSAASEIKIGNHVLIGTGVIITDSDAHPIHPADRRGSGQTKVQKVSIGDDTFIGARSFILKGVTIGRGSVVGAGSVVTRDVEPFSVVGGNPAKVVGTVRDR
ncbi:MAG: acyltransferase [Deltaproteobacteria bacterium]|jgi:acetyltransferase-like isoleucine patch superfamily enzyme|nr:acyltransferase [Deltaproteobacteria bacterium]